VDASSYTNADSRAAPDICSSAGGRLSSAHSGRTSSDRSPGRYDRSGKGSTRVTVGALAMRGRNRVNARRRPGDDETAVSGLDRTTYGVKHEKLESVLPGLRERNLDHAAILERNAP